MTAGEVKRGTGLGLISVFALASLVVLLGLGFWQLQRLSWKEALIAQIESRAQRPPARLSEALKVRASGGDINFLRVRLNGTYDHSNAQYLYSISRGEWGWRVLTPMRVNENQTVLIDRGFLPDALVPVKMAGKVELPAGPTTIMGAVRDDYSPKGWFIPDNKPEKNRWFWLDMVALKKATSLPALLPDIVQLEINDHPGRWPQAAPVTHKLPNKHFAYALTWFGLAITLLGVYIAFVIQERRKRKLS